LSQSLSQNRDAAAGGKGRPSAEEYAREVREAYDAIEEPVDAIREVGAPARRGRSVFVPERFVRQQAVHGCPCVCVSASLPFLRACSYACTCACACACAGACACATDDE